ncbi:hypothetical protein VP01_4535g1 [Puccinia sorghi]|uniref:Uncharacterized protein n=1 Tax=Puccinia sorghi TaxID=27349 RepID=A0A0L6UPR3_9BASI|nr:hypothetical protein VP01_4535g1 [Puccinia sorghi]
MDAVNPTIFQTAIEVIHILTEENFSRGEPKLVEEKKTTLCAVIVSKTLTTTQSNIVTSENEDISQLLWKAILKFIISSKPSN